MTSSSCILFVLTALVVAAAAASVAARPRTVGAAEAITRAVAERMGEVEVEVLELTLPDDAPAAFVEAVPDPAARLGRPVRFTLRSGHGLRVRATATIRVTGPHLVAARDLRRGTTLQADDVRTVTGELVDVPIRRLPAADQAAGSRVLRPVPAGAVLLPGSVVIRRAVEPGDRVTAIAIAGDIRVSAELTARDGGEPGDLIRVVNTDTRRSLHGRVIGEGVVEVGYAR